MIIAIRLALVVRIQWNFRNFLPATTTAAGQHARTDLCLLCVCRNFCLPVCRNTGKTEVSVECCLGAALKLFSFEVISGVMSRRFFKSVQRKFTGIYLSLNTADSSMGDLLVKDLLESWDTAFLITTLKGNYAVNSKHFSFNMVEMRVRVGKQSVLHITLNRQSSLESICCGLLECIKDLKRVFCLHHVIFFNLLDVSYFCMYK